MEGGSVRIIFIFDKDKDGEYESLDKFIFKIRQHFDVKVYDPIGNGDYIVHIKN